MQYTKVPHNFSRFEVLVNLEGLIQHLDFTCRVGESNNINPISIGYENIFNCVVTRWCDSFVGMGTSVCADKTCTLRAAQHDRKLKCNSPGTDCLVSQRSELLL